MWNKKTSFFHLFQNPSLKIESSTSFEELGLSYGILDVLGVNHFKNPTVIQSKAIPEILNGL